MCGGGAAEDLIRECEASLNIRFPASYRSFLEEFGWGYFGSLELIAGLGRDIPEEWQRGANIVHVVTDERSGPLQCPLDIIPFCQSGAGDWYALDCRSRIEDESPVVVMSHERAAGDGWLPVRCADSFAHWILVHLADDQQQASGRDQGQ